MGSLYTFMGCIEGKICNSERDIENRLIDLAKIHKTEIINNGSSTDQVNHFQMGRSSRVSVSLASNETKEFTIDEIVTEDWHHNPKAQPRTKSVLKKVQKEESDEESESDDE